MNAIQTDKLTKYYGNSRGIIDVDINVEIGDFYGFIGPNGAGKSTTIRTLLGLISPTKGDAQILGQHLGKNNHIILSKIGYLPSETVFYSGMKVSELLSLSARLRGINCAQESKVLCERLELDTTKKISELSFGNRKKVGIICALQHRPELCILDEPTSSLDPLMQREFYSILSERNSEGTTIFLSSHVLSEVGKYCKKAAVIKEGRILVEDTVEKLAHTGVKRVTVKGDMQIHADENVKDVRREDDLTSFLYNGDPDKLIAYLGNLKPIDFSVTDPDLEEVFMHYYKKGE
jgi:ABC-2 type transport system ATP-binding protein